MYSDFREVDGIRVPFNITSLTDGRQSTETVVAKLEYNTGLTRETSADLSFFPRGFRADRAINIVLRAFGSGFIG